MAHPLLTLARIRLTRPNLVTILPCFRTSSVRPRDPSRENRIRISLTAFLLRHSRKYLTYRICTIPYCTSRNLAVLTNPRFPMANSAQDPALKRILEHATRFHINLNGQVARDVPCARGELATIYRGTLRVCGIKVTLKVPSGCLSKDWVVEV